MHLHKTMPHWTPSHSDSVVYATVDEDHSGTFEHVGDYLSKLKTDLKIGQESYPSCVIAGGDQQIYTHMKNLKIKYSERYEWVYHVPGEWHTTKTAAEALRGIILNGGSAYSERNVASREILISYSGKIYTAYWLVCMKCC